MNEKTTKPEETPEKPTLTEQHAAIKVEQEKRKTFGMSGGGAQKPKPE